MIVVVVAEDGLASELRFVDACLFRDIREGSVALIVIQHVGPVIDHIEVVVSVVVVIPKHGIHAHALVPDSGLGRDLVEPAVTLVAVKPIARGVRFGGTIDQIDVQVPVAIVIA